MKRPDKLVNIKKDSNIPDSIKDLGIRLSEQLPTYDVPIDLISPNDWNINDMNDSTFNRLVKEIEDNGVIQPIQIIPCEGGKFKIISGEHRWHAVRMLSCKTIPCNILTDDRFIDIDLQKFLTIRMNAIHGEPVPEKFVSLYEEMANKYGKEQLQALFGYVSSDAWKKLTSSVEKELKRAGLASKDLLDEFKKRTSKTKNIDGLGKILTDLFSEYGSDLKHSFMFFNYGGKNHLYVIMDSKMEKKIKEITDGCRENGTDINDILCKVIGGYNG